MIVYQTKPGDALISLKYNDIFIESYSYSENHKPSFLPFLRLIQTKTEINKAHGESHIYMMEEAGNKGIAILGKFFSTSCMKT